MNTEKKKSLIALNVGGNINFQFLEKKYIYTFLPELYEILKKKITLTKVLIVANFKLNS